MGISKKISLSFDTITNQSWVPTNTWKSSGVTSSQMLCVSCPESELGNTVNAQTSCLSTVLAERIRLTVWDTRPSRDTLLSELASVVEDVSVKTTEVWFLVSPSIR